MELDLRPGWQRILLFRADFIGPEIFPAEIARLSEAVIEDGRPMPRFRAAGGAVVPWIEGKRALEAHIENTLITTAGYSLGDFLESETFSSDERGIALTSFQDQLEQAFRELRIISFRLGPRGWEAWTAEFHIDLWRAMSELDWRFLLSGTLPTRYVYPDRSGLRSESDLVIRSKAFAFAKNCAADGWPWRTKPEAIDAICKKVWCTKSDAEAAWRAHAPDAGKRGRKRGVDS